jgi:hypothetical protein
MEPTLISVLAVKSLRKMELIGDHRQLPAFIQNCWFNLESSLPSIKTSLFERLISEISTNRKKNYEESQAAVPHTVLDEQRRMTSSISDVTRPHYSDVVTIIDHSHTMKQRLGDVCLVDEKKALILHRSIWQNSLQDIPGVKSNIFFWNLSGTT